MEKVAVHAGHKVLMEVDNNTLVIVGNPWGILDQQLWPCPTHKININYFNLLY